MIKHRKLYPTSDNNSTLPCPDICDSSCPYGCDPYGDGYLLPPPWPSPPIQDSPSVLSKPNGHSFPFVIVMVTLLVSCFFAVIFYLLLVKFRPRWNFFRRRQRQPSENTNEEFLDENHGPTTAIDYPIWYINTIGLQPSVIESITIFRYKKGESLIEGAECSVCLNEFRNDDTLRLLPKCSHAFHISCIDTWLRSHVNCPVCRAGIVSTTATSIPVASNQLNSNSLRPNEDIQFGDTELGEILNANQATEDEFGENRTETGEIIESQQVDHVLQDADIVKVNVISKEISDCLVFEDDSNGGRTTEEGIDHDDKPMRKCVSAESLMKISVCSSESGDTSEDRIPGGISSKNVSENPKTVRNTGDSSSITQLLHKRPVRMKRSFSYSGRSTKLFSRQNSRNQSAVSSSTPDLYQLRRMDTEDQMSE